MTSDRTTITLSRDTIEKSITSIIHHPNKEAIAKLLFESVMQTVRGEECLVRFLLGDEYPEIPEVHTFGYVDINKCLWIDKEKKIELTSSPLYENGFYPCEVLEFSGLTNFNQLKVSLSLPGDTLHVACTLSDFRLNIDDF
jgi:hypothetical protein